MFSGPGLAVRLTSLLAWGLAGCYNPPALQEGAPCQRTEQCPDPQQCVLGRCTLHADAPPPDGHLAAPPDARADAAMIDAMEVPCIADGLSCGGNAAPMVVKCGGQCWAKCTNLAMRAAAETACTGWGGALAEIDNATEQGCVAGMIGNATLWIGASQGTGAALPGDRWTWNGDPAHPLTTATYSNWVTGKPDDGVDGTENGQEQCAAIVTGGGWDDDGCGATLGFLCRRPTFR